MIPQLDCEFPAGRTCTDTFASHTGSELELILLMLDSLLLTTEKPVIFMYLINVHSYYIAFVSPEGLASGWFTMDSVRLINDNGCFGG